MSQQYGPPASMTHHWPLETSVPLTSLHNAQPIHSQNVHVQLPDPNTNTQSLTSSNSHPVTSSANDWNRAQTSNSAPIAHSNSHVPLDSVTPSTPAYASDSGTSLHPNAPNPPSISSLSVGVLDSVMGAYDKVVRGRLSEFEAVMKSFVDHQTYSNAAYMNEVNTRIAEGQSAFSKRLEEHVHDYEQKRAQMTRDVFLSVDLWQREIADNFRTTITSVGEETVKQAIEQFGPQIDEKKLLAYFCAAGKVSSTLELKAKNQRSTIESIAKEVKSSCLSIQTQLESFDARLRPIEYILSKAASAIITSAPSTTVSSVSTSSSTPHGHSTIPVASTPKAPTPVDPPVAPVTPEVLASSIASLKSHFSECTSSMERMVAQLANNIKVARDEAHSDKQTLADMLELMHSLQSEKMKRMQNEIDSLKCTMGGNAPQDNPLASATATFTLHTPAVPGELSEVDALPNCGEKQGAAMHLSTQSTFNVIKSSPTANELADAHNPNLGPDAAVTVMDSIPKSTDSYAFPPPQSGVKPVGAEHYRDKSTAKKRKESLDGPELRNGKRPRSVIEPANILSPPSKDSGLFPLNTEEESEKFEQEPRVDEEEQTEDPSVTVAKPLHDVPVVPAWILTPAKWSEARNSESLSDDTPGVIEDEESLSPTLKEDTQSESVTTTSARCDAHTESVAHATSDKTPPASSFDKAVRGDSPSSSLAWSDREDESASGNSADPKTAVFELVCPRPSCAKRFWHKRNLVQHKTYGLCSDLRAAEKANMKQVSRVSRAS